MSTSLWIGVATVLYLVASLVYMVAALTGSRGARQAARATALLALMPHTAAIAARIIEAGRPPLTNTYETLLFFSLALVIIYLVLEQRYSIHVVGTFAFPVAFLALAATTLPVISSEIQPLLPSLKSNWLLAHVLTCFVAYAAFGVAFAAGLVYVVLKALPSNPGRERRLELLDGVTYRAVTFGFPLLTLGIVTGAVWANICWGRYWGWDPKETWSLITWIVYGIYLHVRQTRAWRGRWAAWAAIAGFIAVVFTYLGVNYLFAGLHSYA